MASVHDQLRPARDGHPGLHGLEIHLCQSVGECPGREDGCGVDDVFRPASPKATTGRKLEQDSVPSDLQEDAVREKGLSCRAFDNSRDTRRQYKRHGSIPPRFRYHSAGGFYVRHRTFDRLQTRQRLAVQEYSQPQFSIDRNHVDPLGSVIASGWSSPVARLAHNQEVVGSNPTPATISRRRDAAAHANRRAPLAWRRLSDRVIGVARPLPSVGISSQTQRGGLRARPAFSGRTSFEASRLTGKGRHSLGWDYPRRSVWRSGHETAGGVDAGAARCPAQGRA